MKYLKSMAWITGLLMANFSLADVMIQNNSSAPVKLDGNRSCAAGQSCTFPDPIQSVTVGDESPRSISVNEGIVTVDSTGGVGTSPGIPVNRK